MLLVMYFVFRSRFGQDISAYPLYLLVGIVSVSFFTTTTASMLKIFLTHRDFILNSTVPRETLILSNLFFHTHKFLIELILCSTLSIFYGLFTWRIFLLLLPLLIAYVALILGVGIILSLIYCFTRDIEHIWMIVSRLLFFATPIFYTLDSLSPLMKKVIYWGNPLAPFIISFQEILMKGVNTLNYAHSLILGCGFFILGYCCFIIFENTAVERA